MRDAIMKSGLPMLEFQKPGNSTRFAVRTCERDSNNQRRTSYLE